MRSRMRRRPFPLLAATCLLAAAWLTGCAPKEDEPSAPASPSAAAQNVRTEERAVPAVGSAPYFQMPTCSSLM